MPHKEMKQPAFEDVASCEAAAFEWAESFDTKDWDRLAKCLAPTLYVDYRGVMGMIWESMPAADFVHMVSSQKFLGNLCIKTQHFIGASKYVQTGDQTIEGLHQMRVAHQKYESDNLDIVLYHGHAHGSATIRYACVEGVWKFAGLVPDIRWSEGEYSKMFRGD